MNEPHQSRRTLLDIIVAQADDLEQIARRAVLLAKLHNCPSMRKKSQREIAKFLGVTEVAVSKRLTSIRRICNTCRSKDDVEEL